MEMHELDAAATAHHLPRCHRRVNPPRHQRHRIAAGVHGHAAVALYRVEIDQHAVVQYINEDLQVSTFQPDPGTRQSST